ncbi:hypothetical protein BHE74_00012192, partial [Ensete ventricosum]
QDENIDQIFTAEVKPLIEGLFRGHNGCVIAYGARGSGKSQLIQNPTICQDTLSAVNLASRSSQVANRHRCHSAKVIKSGSKFNQSCSPSIVGIHVRAVSQKKNEISQCASSEKKGYGTPYAVRR